MIRSDFMNKNQVRSSFKTYQISKKNNIKIKFENLSNLYVKYFIMASGLYGGRILSEIFFFS